jgi:hypothetical protein
MHLTRARVLLLLLLLGKMCFASHSLRIEGV